MVITCVVLDPMLIIYFFVADISGLSAFVKASKQSVPSKVCTCACKLL